FQSVVLAQGRSPLDHGDEIVQLEQVDVIHAEAIEGTADLLARSSTVTVPGLRRQEDAVAVVGEPPSESQLRIAVRRGGVDVVHAVLESYLEGTVGLRLGDTAERRSTEDRARALVPCLAERRLRDHQRRVPA